MELSSYFNDSNSIKDETTGEIKITASINVDDPNGVFLRSPCKITSDCSAQITFSAFVIETNDCSFTNINFDGQFLIKESNNISFTGCNFKSSEAVKRTFIIVESKNIILDHVDITGNSVNGLYIDDKSEVAINETSIHDTDETIVVVQDKSKVDITNSKIYNTKANGIYIDNESIVTISATSFINTVYPAISATNSICNVKNSELKNIAENCISFSEVKNFIFENNKISDGKATGLSIYHSSGIIRYNNISNLEGNAILCSNQSDAEIIENDLFDNLYPAIVIQKKSNAQIISNRIRRNNINGISLRNAANVIIKNTEITDVKECGISISDSEMAMVTLCEIKNCKVTGVECYNSSSISVIKNSFSGIGKYAFLSYISGYILAKENAIDDVKIAMAKLCYKGKGEFINNAVSSCPQQCECLTSADYFFSNNGDFNDVTNVPSKASKTIKLEKRYVDSNNNKLCLKCKLKPHNCFLLPCSHRVYCEKCANEAFKNKELCPLCRFPIDNVSNGFKAGNDNTCIICYTNNADCIILPCGHMGVCSECLENWLDKNNNCPICRADSCFYKPLTDI